MSAFLCQILYTARQHDPNVPSLATFQGLTCIPQAIVQTSSVKSFDNTSCSIRNDFFNFSTISRLVWKMLLLQQIALMEGFHEILGAAYESRPVNRDRVSRTDSSLRMY